MSVVIIPRQVRQARIKQALKEMKPVTPIIEEFLYERNMSKNTVAGMSDTQLRILHSSYILHWGCYRKYPLIPYYLFKAVCENNPEIYYPDFSIYRTEEEIINDYVEYIKMSTVKAKNNHIRFYLSLPKFYKYFYGEMYNPEVRINWVRPIRKYFRMGNVACKKNKNFECILDRKWKTTHNSYKCEQEFWENNPAVRVEEI